MSVYQRVIIDQHRFWAFPTQPAPPTSTVLPALDANLTKLEAPELRIQRNKLQIESNTVVILGCAVELLLCTVSPPENRLFHMIRFTFICNYSKAQIPSGGWKTVIVAPTGSPLGNLVKPQLLSRIGGIFHAMFDNPMGYECSCSGWITNEDFSSPDVFLDPLIHGCWGVLRQPNGPYLF